MKEARYLMERLVAPAGRKISLKDYMRAYEGAFSHTSTKHAPWYIIPADNKWFMRLAVAAIMHQTLQDLDLRYLTVSREKKAELQQARDLLLAEKD
jgi:hypothetical protein